ncbi:D-glycero-alpha-D-manno-heptose-1,7-bisphosphate 7-phosphatase [candidate division KSB1 bacterium]
MDRDGTISVEKGYIKDADDLELIDKAGEALFELMQNGFKLIVITNQAGVARGYFTEKEVAEVNNRLEELLNEKNVRLDSIQYCPHYPDPEKAVAKEYLADCECRKPGTANVLRAAQEYSIDLSRSFFIGDKMSDIGCGKNAGMRTVLVRTGYGRDEEEKLKELAESEQPDNYADDLYNAVKWIMENLE